MNILISINSKFVDIATDMLYSIKKYNNINLNIYLIYNDIEKNKLENFSKYIINNIGTLYLIPFKPEISFPIYNKNISIETYFRLYAPYFLPNDLDRILYLDADIIVNGNLEKFYNQSFDGKILVGINNFDNNNYIYNKNLNLPPDHVYINAGVLLINLDLYRKQYSIENINEYIINNSKHLIYQDQDAINYLFHNKIKIDSNKYNLQISNLYGYFYNPIIVHYVNSLKPWSLKYDNPNKAKYLYEILKEKDPIREKKLREEHLNNYMNKEIILSIIVPVYNVKEYIEKCIKNISTQRIEDIEIICIDDGSNDGCSKLLDEYSKIDYRIKVIHQENKGLSAARNIGLEIARGKYIGFIDSDDYPSLNMYDELINFLEQNNLDMVVCNFYHLINKKVYIDKKITNNIIYDNKNDIILETIKDNIIRNFVWSKVYKKELWNGVLFPVGKNYEDIVVSIPIAEKTNRIGYYAKPLYYYNHRENSISKSKDFKKIHDAIENTYDRYLYINEKYPKLYKENLFYLLYRVATEYYENTISSKEFFIEEFKDIINYIRSNITKIDYSNFNNENKEKVNNFLEELNNYINLKNV